LEVVHCPPELKGFQILPRRWVVERTFDWLGYYRRLAIDYEYQVLSSESMVFRRYLLDIEVFFVKPEFQNAL
jgi:putative transposase